VPGWHEATADLQAAGKLQMVGIIQEQHPERARLFMQWKRMGWPILVDSLNLLDVSVVPITLLIDEHGIIRGAPPPRGEFRAVAEQFLAGSFEAPERTVVPGAAPDLAQLERSARRGDAADWRRLGEALMLWGGVARRDDAIAALERAVSLAPADGRVHFRLGVAYRARYDDPRGGAADFRSAVSHWSRALQIDPNQYIWRRRIQQFGPRLEKPYPFYDWVETARSEILDRSETPAPLAVEPRGAEIALPAGDFLVADGSSDEPDPEGRIHRDPGKLIRVHTATVPPEIRPGATARMYVELRPDPSREAHWNNEMRGLVFWVDPPPGFEVDRRRVEIDNPPQPVSDETRRIEFEIRTPASGETTRLSGYALYYVCEGIRGQCLYRRQDITMDVALAEGGS
jgi:hypothetical protein